MSLAAVPDSFEARIARAATGLLREFNLAGVLSAADVHVAQRLAEMGGEGDETVALATALAVRAPRLAHVHVDLARIRENAAVDGEAVADLESLPWPEPEAWLAKVSASDLVAVGEAEGGPVRPLRLVATWLYLDRYWAEERALARDLLAMSEGVGVDEPALARDLEALFPGDEASERQRLAAATAVRRRLSVIAGGPGTGKTTTVARIVALLHGQAAATGAPPPLVALAAPTGKAAARLEEAVHDEAGKLAVGDELRERLLGLGAFTLHRLLGRRPDSNSRFRHDRHQHLPYDVVIVDETSMVPLSLMGRLVEAVRPGARLVLIGDPGQLASIEAGAVLGDIVGPAGTADDGAAPRSPEPPRGGALRSPASARSDERREPARSSIADGIVVLDKVHRFGGAIARLAAAVRRGDADAAVELLAEGEEHVVWLEVDVAERTALELLGPVRRSACGAGRAAFEAARGGDARRALDALGRFRLLCAHRRGPYGVAAWSSQVEAWLAAAVDEFESDRQWYAGRPLLVVENDYELGLYNGDTGVVVAGADGRLSAAFERRGEVVELAPTRLGAIDTVYAMTVHKSQGSQFDAVAVLLPGADSRILTRELLYTAVTRARKRVIVAGTEAVIRAAIERPIARASGLGGRLWNPAPS